MRPLMSRSAISPLHAPAQTKRRSLFLSLTTVCFLFGGLMAVQLRAVEQSHINQVSDKQRLKEATARLLVVQEQLRRERADRARLASELAATRERINHSYVPIAKATQLTEQVKELGMVAGLKAVSGPGLTVTLRDNAQATTGGVESVDASQLVHDYDLQQTVHELLSAKAEAIAIKGADGPWIRITGYTPIRCVGPTVYINFHAVAAPFTIAAIGRPATMRSALETPGGLISNFKRQNLGVKIAMAKNLNLPAMEGKPRFSDARAIEAQ